MSNNSLCWFLQGKLFLAVNLDSYFTTCKRKTELWMKLGQAKNSHSDIGLSNSGYSSSVGSGLLY